LPNTGSAVPIEIVVFPADVFVVIGGVVAGVDVVVEVGVGGVEFDEAGVFVGVSGGTNFVSSDNNFAEE
jgi:hypothetical protein